jgi:hypothetical protein
MTHARLSSHATTTLRGKAAWSLWALSVREMRDASSSACSPLTSAQVVRTVGTLGDGFAEEGGGFAGGSG